MSKKRIPPQEMLDDLSKMGDMDFVAKWNVSRIVPIKLRKRYGIESFTKQHGLIPHKIENGKEYKWCGCGHWELIENFGKHTSRYDGLRGNCKFHTNEFRKGNYDRNDGAKIMRDWLKTENGKASHSATMRKMWEKRRGCYVKFDYRDELKIYRKCRKSCAYCKTPMSLEDIEFDHFIPVKLGGKTEITNMLPACPTCNRGKNGKFHKHPHDWLIGKFGPVYGEKIYNKCVSILESIRSRK